MSDIQIDTSKVIERLTKRIGELTQETVILTVYVEQLAEQLEEATVDKGEKDSPEETK